MKKAFLKTFIVLGFFSIFFINMTLPVVRAQVDPSMLVGYLASGAVKTQQTIAASAEAAKGVPSSVASSIMQVVVVPAIETGLLGILTGVQLIFQYAGKGFDLVVKEFLVEKTLSDLVEAPILIAWKLIRDVSNIVIVFSLLYLGIRTILNGNGFADTRTLVGVLIAAIFINFSLFLTQAVYNVSNFVAVQIGQQIQFEGEASSGLGHISAGIMGIIKPQSLINVMSYFGGANDGSILGVVGKAQAVFLTSFVLIMLLIILFAAGVMILYRFLVFIVLMVMSPIGLIGMFIPWLNGVGQKWWSQVRSQALFMPAFMLTLYVSLLFVGYISQRFGQVDFSSSVLGNNKAIESFANNSLAFFFNFALVFGFLMLIIILPTKIAGAGSELMLTTSKWAAKRVGEFTARGAAFAGRNTLGRAGARLVNSPTVQAAANSRGLGGLLAKGVIKAGNSAQSKTFDPRNVGGIGKKLDLGTSVKGVYNKGGYKQKLDDATKDAKQKRDEELKLFGVKDQQKIVDQAKKEFGDNYVEAIRGFDNTASRQKVAAYQQEAAQLQSQLEQVKASKPQNPADINRKQSTIRTLEKQIADVNKGREAEQGKAKFVNDFLNSRESRPVARRMLAGKKVGFEAYKELMQARITGGNVVTKKLKWLRNMHVGGHFWFNPKMKSYQKVVDDFAKVKTWDAYEKGKKEEDDKKAKENARKLRQKELEEKDNK